MNRLKGIISYVKWVISFQEIAFKFLKFLLESFIIRNNPSITLSLTQRYTLLAWYWMTWRIFCWWLFVFFTWMEVSKIPSLFLLMSVDIKKCSLFSGIMVRKFDPWMCIVEILNESKQFIFRILSYKKNIIQESKPEKGILMILT